MDEATTGPSVQSKRTGTTGSLTPQTSAPSHADAVAPNIGGSTSSRNTGTLSGANDGGEGDGERLDESQVQSESLKRGKLSTSNLCKHFVKSGTLKNRNCRFDHGMGPDFSDLPTCPEIEDDLIVGVFTNPEGQ